MPRLDPIEELLNRIRRGNRWPLQSEAAVIRRLKAWRAFADSDRDALKLVADWPTDRELHVDPLPELVAETWGDYLAGDEFTLTPANEADTDRLDALIEANDLAEELRAAIADYMIPEGETWWRIVRDPDLADVPLVEWHSRLSFIPYYIGRRLLAAAFVVELEGPANIETASNAVFRHFEVHAQGRTLHVLFRGTRERLGREVPLEAHSETEELAQTLGPKQEWDHGLGFAGNPNAAGLVGRLINRRGRDPRLGRSEFARIRDYFLDLNEAMTIAAENARVAAKKRAVVPAEALNSSNSALDDWRIPDRELVDNGEGQFVPRVPRPRNRYDAGEDVLVHDPLNSELGKDGPAPYTVLEYTYDAEQLIHHKRDLVESALTRVGLTPQWVGVRVEGDGYAASGTSLRLRLIPTDRAGRGKGRQIDTDVPRIVCLLAQVDELGEHEGGFGADWTVADELPGFARGRALPPDEVEEAGVEATLVGAGVRSIRTSVQRQHPEWDEEAVDVEVALIREDRKAAAPSLPGLGNPGGLA
jgi:hypothetical protein